MSERLDPEEYMAWKEERGSDEGRYATASLVNVARSDGRVEPGWKVAAKSPEGNVTIVKEGTGEIKIVTAEELDRFNKFPGDTVSVQRTDGTIENDWTFKNVDENGKIILEKKIPGKILTKRVTQEDFIALNYDIETDENRHHQ
ncbi:MAG: hypothetical protein PHW75_03255 [Patescibacteria group bacterium]|nr:hypothetical protein [Patescibacteria group bacterium]